MLRLQRLEEEVDEGLQPVCQRGCHRGAGPRDRFHLVAPVRPGDAEFLVCAGTALERGAVYTDPTRPGEWIQVQSQPAPRRARVLRACGGSISRFHDRGAVWTLVRSAAPWRITLGRPRTSTGARVVCPQGSPTAPWLGAPRAAHRCQIWVERPVLGGFFAARLECPTCGYAGPALVRRSGTSPRPPANLPPGEPEGA
jgi:hypothetical protein